jgi:hypothetical protein
MDRPPVHTLSRAPPYGFGIAPALAGPSPSVISHLWPTTVAAVFGATLADALARTASHLQAFTSAVKALANGRVHPSALVHVHPRVEEDCGVHVTALRRESPCHATAWQGMKTSPSSTDPAVARRGIAMKCSAHAHTLSIGADRREAGRRLARSRGTSSSRSRARRWRHSQGWDRWD